MWDKNNDTSSSSHIIFYCASGDYWVLTSSYWRQGLIDSNGGGCGGFETTFAGTGAEFAWWEYTWQSDATFEFPP